MSSRRLVPLIGLLALALGGWQLGGAVWIHGKAWAAQVLLDRAWRETRGGARQVPPWPWADTWPVARLSVPAHGVERIVLAGASGRVLAFGPGYLESSAPPGRDGHTILTGHRDTHFAFLANLTVGETVVIERPDKGRRRYRVRAAEVIDARNARLLPADGTTVLSLVTCYPFDAVAPGGPLRYVVTAEAIPD